jgi:uncharacterized protein DUF3489
MAALNETEIPMTKSAKKRSTPKSAASSHKHSNPKKMDPKQARAAVRSSTKQSATIAMLRSPGGASLDALAKATGWQQHSVRGFLAGVVRKRLKLDLESAVIDGIRTYQITDGHGIGSKVAQPAGRKS